MNRLYVILSIATLACYLVFSNSMTAQTSAYSPKVLPPAPKSARVQITQGPELELASDKSAIIRWTSNNPGGSDEHFGVVHFGTNPKEISQTAKSPIRLNQNHPYTVFRVRVDGLASRTTYYYTVDSMTANGTSDGLKSSVNHFTTP
jgi:Purple acid Phosphatase, N-terminal domain